MDEFAAHLKGPHGPPVGRGHWLRSIALHVALKVLGKSVGLCKTSKKNYQLYISLIVSVWRIVCENFNPNGLILAEI